MKDFNERKAEILRRASERITRRKTIKNRILSIAIPFFVLGVALSVFLSGGFLSEKSKGVESTEPYEEDFFADSATDDFFADAQNSYADSIPDWYIAGIMVSDNNGLLKEYTADNDSETINEIKKIINGVFDFGAGNDEFESSTSATIPPSDNNQDEEVKGQGNITEYKIQIVDSLGEKAVFVLKGYKLTDIDSGETVTLDNTQRDNLLNTLGLKEN